MAFSGVAVAYCATGGLVLYSGIKGSTIADTVKAMLSGSLTVQDTEPVNFSDTSASDGSTTSDTSGTASQNYLTIAKYLVSNGYSNAGAAGVVACIAGESGGNPEAVEDPAAPSSGGIGLIQWSPPNTQPTLTGNASKDLDSQLPMIIEYNNNRGAGLVAMLNAITDPVQAADFYSQNFEAPAVKDSDVVASVATQVFNELKGSTPAPTPSGSQPVNIGEL